MSIADVNSSALVSLAWAVVSFYLAGFLDDKGYKVGATVAVVAAIVNAFAFVAKSFYASYLGLVAQ